KAAWMVPPEIGFPSGISTLDRAVVAEVQDDLSVEVPVGPPYVRGYAHGRRRGRANEGARQHGRTEDTETVGALRVAAGFRDDGIHREQHGAGDAGHGRVRRWPPSTRLSSGPGGGGVGYLRGESSARAGLRQQG